MYSLMLVEDEPIVLEGMMKIIDFEALGYEVVCACSNGVEALEAYKKLKPDVVVTDICMEFMDGLEFIENAQEVISETKFIIVSGHQDFKFFKKALSLQVADYILKPVTAKEFRELLTRIGKELCEKSNCSEVETHVGEYLEVEKNMFFNKLMHMKLDDKEVKDMFERLNIDFSHKYFQVSLFKMDDLNVVSKLSGYNSSDELLNLLYSEIKTFSDSVAGSVAFIDPQGSVVYISNGEDKDVLIQTSKELSKKVYSKYKVKDIGNINCYTGFVVESIDGIMNSFKSANRLNVCGILNNGIGYYESEIILFNRANRTYNYQESMNEWIKALIFGEAVAMDKLEDMFVKFMEVGFLLTDLKATSHRMMDTLNKELELVSIKIPGVTDYHNEHKSEDEIKSELIDITKRLTTDIDKSNVNKDTYIAVKAIKYIEKNFADSNIDLQQVCKHLNVSVSYFSSVFKKHTDITFIKYLNNYRIDKAKYLLEFSQYSITEISGLVGYLEAHYFGIVFKKYALTTPKKYRMMRQ